MFNRCHRSRAAVTPVKYERDIQRVTSILTMLKNRENNGTGRNWFSNPHPWWWSVFCGYLGIIIQLFRDRVVIFPSIPRCGLHRHDPSLPLRSRHDDDAGGEECSHWKTNVDELQDGEGTYGQGQGKGRLYHGGMWRAREDEEHKISFVMD